jgi:hypothetical protein
MRFISSNESMGRGFDVLELCATVLSNGYGYDARKRFVAGFWSLDGTPEVMVSDTDEPDELDLDETLVGSGSSEITLQFISVREIIQLRKRSNIPIWHLNYI